jgi:hypothetical protein
LPTIDAFPAFKEVENENEDDDEDEDDWGGVDLTLSEAA